MEKDTEFITCKYDVAFKEVFLKEENKDLLLEILKTCLPYDIQDVRIINSEILQGHVKVKRKTLDVLLDANMGRINVEINSNVHSYTRDRNLCYVCNVHGQNITRGSSYRNLKKTIQINLSYGIKKNDEPFKIYHMLADDLECFSEKLIIYEFNMDKIMEFWYSKDEENIKKYKYLIMLDLDSKELDKLSLTDKKVGRYKMELECVNVTIGVNDIISKEKDREMIENSLLEEGFDNGKKEMILKLYKLDTPIDILAKASNLTEEEVKKIINENK